MYSTSKSQAEGKRKPCRTRHKLELEHTKTTNQISSKCLTQKWLDRIAAPPSSKSSRSRRNQKSFLSLKTNYPKQSQMFKFIQNHQVLLLRKPENSKTFKRKVNLWLSRWDRPLDQVFTNHQKIMLMPPMNKLVAI